MVTEEYAAVENSNFASNREFACGVVEVSESLVKFNLSCEFVTIAESGAAGIIPLDSADEDASIDKMRAAADYFDGLAQDLRQAAKLYQSRKTGTVTPVEAKPLNQQQQTEHLERIHAILEQLPDEEKAIYQGFGFGERARLYKMIDYETDSSKMQATICKMIKAISENKHCQG